MTALLEKNVWSVARPAVLEPVGVTSITNPLQYVPAEVHQTPPEIMKKDLPQRIHQLMEMHGSPLLIMDKSKLIEEYKFFRRALPRVRLYYAVKANPHPDIV